MNGGYRCLWALYCTNTRLVFVFIYVLDGTCQPLRHRCDLKADCNDRSDEEDCKKVILPLDYEKALAPKHTINGERVDDPLPVYISLDILSFDKIDTINMEIG